MCAESKLRPSSQAGRTPAVRPTSGRTRCDLFVRPPSAGVRFAFDSADIDPGRQGSDPRAPASHPAPPSSDSAHTRPPEQEPSAGPGHLQRRLDPRAEYAHSPALSPIIRFASCPPARRPGGRAGGVHLAGPVVPEGRNRGRRKRRARRARRLPARGRPSGTGNSPPPLFPLGPGSPLIRRTPEHRATALTPIPRPSPPRRPRPPTQLTAAQPSARRRHGQKSTRPLPAH